MVLGSVLGLELGLERVLVDHGDRHRQCGDLELEPVWALAWVQELEPELEWDLVLVGKKGMVVHDGRHPNRQYGDLELARA